jgi:hypothetical protein
MTPEIKELLTKVYTSMLEAHRRYLEYLTLPLDKRYELMQQHIDNLKNNE